MISLDKISTRHIRNQMDFVAEEQFFNNKFKLLWLFKTITVPFSKRNLCNISNIR